MYKEVKLEVIYIFEVFDPWEVPINIGDAYTIAAGTQYRPEKHPPKLVRNDWKHCQSWHDKSGWMGIKWTISEWTREYLASIYIYIVWCNCANGCLMRCCNVTIIVLFCTHKLSQKYLRRKKSKEVMPDVFGSHRNRPSLPIPVREGFIRRDAVNKTQVALQQ